MVFQTVLQVLRNGQIARVYTHSGECVRLTTYELSNPFSFTTVLIQRSLATLQGESNRICMGHQTQSLRTFTAYDML